MTTTTITRATEVYDLSDEYKLVEEFTLTTTPSTDETVTKMKELLIKLTEERVIGNTEGNAWGSLLLDMVCLKAANRSNWEQPIAHLLPALKRLGSEAQVEQALTEFAADNAPTFTTIEEFQWGRVGGLYWEPHYWWGFLKQYSTPELKKAFFEKMDEFYGEWQPCTPELEEDFAEVDVAAARLAAAKEARQLAEERLKACTPVQVGMTREEYLAVYQASLSGETDVTGVMAAIKQLNMPEQSERRMKYYIQQRIESPTSPVGQKLIAATEGEEVRALVTGMFQSGKYNRTKLPEEPEVVEAEDKEEGLTPQELFEQCEGESNFDPLFADAVRCEDVIMANIKTIALNYTEENEYAATGDEPQWLLSALLKAGAEFGSGGGGDDEDEDEDEERTVQKNTYNVPDNYGGAKIYDYIIKYGMSYEWVIDWLNDWCAKKLKEEGDGISLINLPAGSVSYFSVATLLSENEASGDEEDIRFNNELIERIQQHDTASGYLVMLVVRPGECEFHTIPSAVEQKNEEPGTEFTGKRVCITGKLETARDVWEAWIKDAGGVVASSVSKTTDILIVGKDAGSKLDKAKELGINIIDESAAKFTLGFICEEIQEAWAELIIEKLLSGLPTIEGDGYFRINDGKDVYVKNTDSLTEIKDWLALRIGANSDLGEYSYPEEVERLQVEWVKIDKADNVTVYYFDNEFAVITDLVAATFNTKEDALSFCRNKNSSIGGHLSTVRVVTKQGDSIVSQLGDEADFPNWMDSDIDDIGNNYEDNEELVSLIGGAEKWEETDWEDLKKKIAEIIRKGLWPPIKK